MSTYEKSGGRARGLYHHEDADRAHEQRQIDQIDEERKARILRGEHAIKALHQLKLDLLEVELRFGKNASWEERAGNHHLADHYRRAARLVRQARDGKPLQDLLSEDLRLSVRDAKWQ